MPDDIMLKMQKLLMQNNQHNTFCKKKMFKNLINACKFAFESVLCHKWSQTATVCGSNPLLFQQ